MRTSLETGIALLPFVAFRASRSEPARAAVWDVIALNAVWAVDSVLLLFTSWIAPNALGYAFIAGQAIVVATFAEFEYVGLRRSAAVAT